MKEEVKALQALAFRHYSELRDREQLRYYSFMKFSYFLVFWFAGGLFMMKVVYGFPGTIPGAYFPTVGFVVWAGVLGSVCSLLVRFINMDVRNIPLVAEVESALKTGFGAIVVGSVLSLLVYAAMAGGVIKSDFMPEFISSRDRVVTVEKLDTSSQNAAEKKEEPSNNAPRSNVVLREDLQEKRITEYRRQSEIDGKVADIMGSSEEGFLLRIMRDLMPVSGKSFALLMVWCFFAGYSQTWILDRIKKSLEK